MRRVDDDADEMAGQDSFLDVVTNIVGILILLVMVVGLRSSQAVATAVGPAPAPSAVQIVDEEDVRTAYREVAESEQEIRELVGRAVGSRRDAALREQERLWLNTAVAQTEQEIAARRAELSAQDQRDFDLRRQLSEAQLKLDELTRQQVALLAQEPDVEEIQCSPTPIAKLVRGKQLHVQLCDDCVAVVPFDKLFAQAIDDLEQNLWRLKQEDEMVRTIGPLDGFRLQYCFQVKEFNGRERNGAVVSGRRPEFVEAHFLPVTNPIGEPAVDSMQPGSEFRQRLQQVDPTRTTITIWVYPGNFDRLRELKNCVRELGFQTAIRQLPKDCPIGMSPEGTRSVTE